jgi:hypothetical protein
MMEIEKVLNTLKIEFMFTVSYLELLSRVFEMENWIIREEKIINFAVFINHEVKHVEKSWKLETSFTTSLLSSSLFYSFKMKTFILRLSCSTRKTLCSQESSNNIVNDVWIKRCINKAQCENLCCLISWKLQRNFIIIFEQIVGNALPRSNSLDFEFVEILQC